MSRTSSGPTASRAIAVAAACVALVALVPSAARSASDDFYGLMREAMERMHAGMNVARPTTSTATSRR